MSSAYGVLNIKDQEYISKSKREVPWRCLGFRSCSKEILPGENMIVCHIDPERPVFDMEVYVYCEKCFEKVKKDWAEAPMPGNFEEGFSKIEIYRRPYLFEVEE